MLFEKLFKIASALCVVSKRSSLEKSSSYGPIISRTYILQKQNYRVLPFKNYLPLKSKNPGFSVLHGPTVACLYLA